MTETNDLFEKIRDEIKMVFEPPMRVPPLMNPLDESFLFNQIEAYGQAEFERGRKTGYTEHRFYIDTSFYDLSDENKELKEQNKELMWENVQLIKKYNHCKSWNDKYEERERGHLAQLDAMCKGLSRSCYNAGIDAASEYYEQLLSCSIFSGGEKNRVKHMQDLKRQYAAEAKPSEDGQPEPEWYDAEKCLPFIGRKVEIKYRGCETKTAIAMLWFRNSALVFLIDKSYGRVNPPVVYSLLDVVSKWRYADE